MAPNSDLEGIIKSLEAGIKSELAEIVSDISDLNPEAIDETLLQTVEKIVCSARCRLERVKNGG